ncbi:LPD7 domain-containing protein (plasmid) [Methylobacterium sp. NMS12]|uniref:LPD7 domain-containing protein n=1 Tax=Methylobacterium sp. NMS12 TaxID=3079766 RepID=UPI003F8846A9
MTDDAVEFIMERSARIGSASARREQDRQVHGSPEREEDRNGFPDHIRRKYYVVENPGAEREGIQARVYTDRQGEYLAFKVTGDRLSTRNREPRVVRDMVAVAEHRGWEAISVRGPVEFRREAWLEAGARGLAVRGYEPSEIDHETLRKRLEDRTPRTRDTAHRQDAMRNRRTVAAERFRSLDRREAVRDPELAAAHSNIAVLEQALRAQFPQDERAQRIMLDAAHARVAEHLEQGRSFRRAEIRVPERTTSRDTGEPASRVNHRRQERLQSRERGRNR